MGKPLSQAVNEVTGMRDRTAALIGMAAKALETESFPEAGGIQKRIVKEPVGVVLTIAPWNYPLLTSVNSSKATQIIFDCVALLLINYVSMLSVAVYAASKSVRASSFCACVLVSRQVQRLPAA